MDSVTFQILSLTIGGGAVLSFGGLLYRAGSSHSKLKADVELALTEVRRVATESGLRLSVLERLVIYDRLPTLQAAEVIKRNSPWQVERIAELRSDVSDPPDFLIGAFKRLLREPLPESDALTIHRAIQCIGDEVFEKRAEEWRAMMQGKHPGMVFTYADYAAFWVIAAREAERDGDGGTNVLAKMGITK